MRHHRYWLLLIAIVLGSLAQLAVEGGLNFMTGKINFILVALILLINLTDFSAVAIFGVLAGLILDIYSGLPFGLISVSLFLTLIILEVLFVNFFTNFSFYSLMLMGLIAVIAYNAVFISLAAAMYFVGWSDVLPDLSYGTRIGWQLLTTEILLLIIYWAGGYISRRFKPMFLH